MQSLHRNLSVFLALLFAVLACNLPRRVATPFPRPQILQFIAPTSTPNEQGVILPPDPRPFVEEKLAQVSAENLVNHVNALAALPTRHVNSAGAQAAAEIIYSRFLSIGGRLNVGYAEFELNYNDVPTRQRNVIARLPGSDPTAGILVVGAHYDSRTVNLEDASSPAPGANDNATGVAALLEIARVLANEMPYLTIDLVAFAAEEVGAQGSERYLQAAQARGETIWGVIVLDIIGNSAGPQSGGFIRVYSAEGGSRALAEWLPLVSQAYLTDFVVLLEPRIDRPGRYSDHVPFNAAGIPSLRIIEGVEDFSRQHNSEDLPQYLDADYHRRATQLTLAAIIHLAFGLPLPGE